MELTGQSLSPVLRIVDDKQPVRGRDCEVSVTTSVTRDSIVAVKIRVFTRMCLVCLAKTYQTT